MPVWGRRARDALAGQQQHGGHAAIFVCDAAHAALMKDVNLDPALAVAVVPNGATAYLALTRIARIRDRERVRVHGSWAAWPPTSRASPAS